MLNFTGEEMSYSNEMKYPSQNVIAEKQKWQQLQFII